MSGVITQLATRVTSLARRTRASWRAGFATALLIVAIASLFRWVLTPLGLYSTPFITYFPAVLLATLFGGVWGGIVATLASAGMAWLSRLINPLALRTLGRLSTTKSQPKATATTASKVTDRAKLVACTLHRGEYLPTRGSQANSRHAGVS